jgi:hypothetical protein
MITQSILYREKAIFLKKFLFVILLGISMVSAPLAEIHLGILL